MLSIVNFILLRKEPSYYQQYNILLEKEQKALEKDIVIRIKVSKIDTIGDVDFGKIFLNTQLC